MKREIVILVIGLLLLTVIQLSNIEESKQDRINIVDGYGNYIGSCSDEEKTEYVQSLIDSGVIPTYVIYNASKNGIRVNDSNTNFIISNAYVCNVLNTTNNEYLEEGQ